MPFPFEKTVYFMYNDKAKDENTIAKKNNLKTANKTEQL